MKIIDIFGSYKGPTGYDNVVRNIVSRLPERGITVNLRDFKQWSGKVIEYNSFLDSLMYEEPADVHLNFCLPDQVELNPHKVNFNYTMAESDVICQEWREASRKMDLTIVPTESSRQAWIESGVASYKVKKCPLGVDVEKFRNYGYDLDSPLKYMGSVGNYPIRFMNIHELGPRKNTLGLIHAWILGTQQDREDRCLILKLSSYTPGRIEKFLNRVSELYRELSMTAKDHAPIFYNFKTLTGDEMAELMSVATHYVSATFGEGWDLPAINMALMGKQLILPRHTAYLEWCDEEVVDFVDCQKIPAQAGGGLKKVYDGSNWWAPDIEQLAYKISTVGGVEVTEEHLEFADKLAETYTWDICVDNLLKIIDKQYYNNIKPSVSRRPVDPVIISWTPTMNTECGIAEFSQALNYGIGKIIPDQMVCVGGQRASLMNDFVLDQYKNAVIEHLQMEYQFWSPQRLRVIGLQCRRRGVKLIVTMHTVGVEDIVVPYHNALKEYADVVIVHSDASRAELLEQGFVNEKITVMPMFVPEVEIDEDVQRLPKDKFKIGFFGFLYPHKGVLDLLEAVGGLKEKYDDLFVMMCASQHSNDRSNYIEEVHAYLQENEWAANEDYLWQSEYLPDGKVLGYLKQCDLIVLPYKHYGSIGSSAAVNMCALAKKTMLLSDVCWFSHVPDGIKMSYKLDKLQYNIEAIKINKPLRKVYENNISNWVNEYTIENSAKKHLELYERIAPCLVKENIH